MKKDKKTPWRYIFVSQDEIMFFLLFRGTTRIEKNNTTKHS